MAEKKTTKAKTTKPKTPKFLSLDEAADYIGITPHELQVSRYRGVEPGSLATKRDGVLVWDRTKLTPVELASEPEAREERCVSEAPQRDVASGPWCSWSSPS